MSAPSIQPDRLRRLRLAQGLTQEQLAARIPALFGTRVTVPVRMVAAWEQGDVPVPERYWHVLAGVFGVSVSHLLGTDEPSEPREEDPRD